MKLQTIQIPAFLQAQRLLTEFIKITKQLPEIERIRKAYELCKTWKQKEILMPIPAIPERHDVWYLIQLLSMNRHITDKNSPYLFDMGRDETIYLADNITMFQSLITHSKKNQSVRSKRGMTITISRTQFDILLSEFGYKVVRHFGLSSSDWRLSYIPYDMFLRLSQSQQFDFPAPIFFDGYRYHPSIKKATALIGGSHAFGGVRFIDSLWEDQVIRIYPFLCIIRSDYGKTI